MLDEADFRAWFRLLEVPGLGRDKARELLAHFGSPQAVLQASPTALRALLGPALATAVAVEPPQFASRLAAALAWWRGGEGPGSERHIFSLGDAAYPAALLQTADPPLLLYAQGRLELLGRPSVAIVGSRNPTPQGRSHAQDFARALSEAGWTVVSGLALGIDGAAHEGALEASGSTVAVVGTGLDKVYPTRHRSLAERIAQHSVLLSEFAPGTPALPAHFPLRNRIIAGLSRGTLVVEAALKSGSLITARLAAEAGREVFALPGSIHSPQSQGCHALIKQGAKLVESIADILDELPPQGSDDGPLPRAAAAPLPVAADEEADPLLDALGSEALTLDQLGQRTGWPVAELNARLLTLELQQRVARLPGGRFQRHYQV